MAAAAFELKGLLAADDPEADGGDLEVDASAADDAAAAREARRRRCRVGCIVVFSLAGTALGAGVGGSTRGETAGHEEAHRLFHRVADTIHAQNKEERCRGLVEGEPCDVSVRWAKTRGIFDHPEWYLGLGPEASLEEFHYALFRAGAKNCTAVRPCHADALEAGIAARARTADAAAAEEARRPTPPPGPRAQTFYMYRAQSEASYALENINTADLAGVFWYLHNEVIVATPRKYKIDRIKRFKVTVRNTWEFWNAHKRQFGGFVAYDAGGCTTPVCKDVYNQYGFIVGCQVQPLTVAAYLGRQQTNWQCRAGEDACRAPIWYSLPGPCPARGIPNGKIDPDSTALNVDKYKSQECIRRKPGGHCRVHGEPTGAPDCTYTSEEAGFILLDDLVGIRDYEEFWNTSYSRCMEHRLDGTLPPGTKCVFQKEYDSRTDKGVGLDFWDGKLDKKRCSMRMDKARRLFKEKYPDLPEHLEEPPCEFDMYYEREFEWRVNHTNAPKADWWEHRG